MPVTLGGDCSSHTVDWTREKKTEREVEHEIMLAVADCGSYLSYISLKKIFYIDGQNLICCFSVSSKTWMNMNRFVLQVKVVFL